MVLARGDIKAVGSKGIVALCCRERVYTTIAAVLKLCQLLADLKEVPEEEFELRNKRLWQGKRYYLAAFAVKVIIAPADLKFELWFNDTKYNRGHDPISVEWDAAGASARPRTSDDLSDEWESSVHLTGRLR
ncbi:hypothetical protein EG329_000378 [Mollisiaceae sp. DMI_Dod_QoI]|nr:hypothetical protein EG329_000378 [Helotiales sp. DMI_Dod_QoI]